MKTEPKPGLLARVLDNPIKTALVIASLAALVVFIITAFWNSLSTTILPNTTIGLYNREFWENVLVEMHGMVFELAVVGILLLWLDGRRGEKRDLNQCKEHLADYAEFDFPEAHLKKMSALKRLVSAQVKDLEVHYVNLSGRSLKGVVLNGWSIIGFKLNEGKLTASSFTNVQSRSSNFVHCTMTQVRFTGGSLYRCKFEGATLRDVSFRNVNLGKVEFTHCDMVGTLFDGVTLKDAKYDGANLSRCSFKTANDVDVGELSKAAKLDFIVLSDDLMMKLLALRPEIKYQHKKFRP